MPIPAPKSPKMVLWIVWYVLLSGCFIYPFILGNGWPSGANGLGTVPLFTYLLAYGSIFVSLIIRWVILPRFHSFSQVLTSMIIGMALAEAVVFYGLFLVGSEFPETQMQFYLLGIFGVAQFAPIFAGKLTR